MANGLPLVADGKWQMAFIERGPWAVGLPWPVSLLSPLMFFIHILIPYPILYSIGLDRLSLCCLAWENWLGKQETARQEQPKNINRLHYNRQTNSKGFG
jgi:hypothetical protein